MSPVGLILTIILCSAVLFTKRVYAAIAFLGGAMFITQGQQIDIAGINFMAIRFIEIVMMIRILIRGEHNGFVMNSPDKWFLCFNISYLIVHLIRTQEFELFFFGTVIDATFTYFSFRIIIHTYTEMIDFLKKTTILLLAFSIFMFMESQTGINSFSFMGGVPVVPLFREGHFRCQGSFRHAITAGTLGATFFPLFIPFVFRKEGRYTGMAGIVSCILILLCSHSSGPMMTFVIGVLGWICWFYRKNMKLIQRGIILFFIILHVSMTRPVWFIFDRVSGIIGGGGWHRSNLIDKFINNLPEWWIAGMPLEKTANWAATVTKAGFVDVTNYYVSIGLSSGLISLILFFKLLHSISTEVGNGLRSLSIDLATNEPIALLLWGLGCTIICHAVNLTSVYYWDQSYVIFYLHMAFTVSLALFSKEIKTKEIS